MKTVKRKFVATNTNEYWTAGDIITAYERVEFNFRGCVSDIHMSSSIVKDTLKHALNQAIRNLSIGEQLSKVQYDRYGYDDTNMNQDMTHEYLLLKIKQSLEILDDRMNFIGTVNVTGGGDSGYDVVPMGRETMTGLLEYPRTLVENPIKIVSGNRIVANTKEYNPKYQGGYSLIPFDEKFIEIIKAHQMYRQEELDYRSAARFRYAVKQLQSPII